MHLIYELEVRFFWWLSNQQYYAKAAY